MSEKFGFIYIWCDCKNKKYYIGSHWGTEEDGYICSSGMMRDAHRRRPQDFKRKVIQKIYSDRKELLMKEEKWLKLAAKNPERYYNKNFKTGNGFWWVNEKTKKEIGKKISKINTGRKHTEKTKEKMRGRRISEEHKKHLSKLYTGTKRSNEVREKIRETKKINPFSYPEETKEKMSKLKKEYYIKNPKVTSEVTKKKQSIAQQGRILINNGIIAKWIMKTEIIKEGWNKGKL